MSGPHFVGIGAQKAGTTWLHNRLAELSDFGMPPVKELHYFDRDPAYLSPAPLSKPYFWQRMWMARWRSLVVRSIGRQILRLDTKRLAWLLRFHFSVISDEWYVGLFNDLLGGRIRGEITPAYSILDAAGVEQMHQLIPGTKLLFLIRNPIERAWSNYRYNLKKNPQKHAHLSTPEQIIGYMKRPGRTLRTDYLRTLEVYQQYYAPEQILVGFYDAIREQPQVLLEEIVDFLGGDPSQVGKECQLQAYDNPSPSQRVPAAVREHLLQAYRPMMLELSRRYGGYCTQWVNDAYGEQQAVGVKRATVQLG